ncbi:DcaP family trimeric outer membrane transporter [Algibacter mikhailovii]|uniref:Porin n=1 Tax=Algibacter mikhailovii TaxID=425498 RepID=A0A918QV18_9FLAO|nr:DcaP family trimeric outer membrane transporter [Algibacter mikhailovii]GGZ69807.1 hypothetical protein GCM10007028_03620 [Algibacter mikhailovii]
MGKDSPLKDIHLPGQIPVGSSDENFNLDFHVKESRFNFDVKTTLLGEDIHGFVEVDFLLSAQGNERVSNSFAPRLRHFYFEWGNLLIGQTWSTFMIVVVPDDLDFSGAAEGLVFNRQVQIRYTYNNWQFSIENPETTLMGFKDPAIVETEKEVIPDVVIRRNITLSRGFLGVSFLNRVLSGKTVDKDEVKTKYVLGLSAGGKIFIGNRGSDLRFMTTYGTGLGRYTALGFVAGGVIDENENIHGIQSLNGYIAYNHFWKPKRWSSSVNVSVYKAFNDLTLVGEQANDNAYSLSANIKYTPAPELMFGVELMHGYRGLANNSINGSFNRLQVSAKYSFGYNNTITNEKR